MKLRKPCRHGWYDEHMYYGPTDTKTERCPGGVFLPDDTLIIEKVDGEWPEWATDLDIVPYELTGIVALLDDLHQRST